MREISRPLVAALLLLVSVALPASARAADPAAADPECTCREELDRLLELVEGTYPGHRLEIAPDPERRADYAERVEAVRRAVAGVS